METESKLEKSESAKANRSCGSMQRVGRHKDKLAISCPKCGSSRVRKTPKHMAKWEDEYWCDAHGGYFVPTKQAQPAMTAPDFPSTNCSAGHGLAAAPGYIPERPKGNGSLAGARQTFSTIVADPPWPMPETGQRTDAMKNRGEYTAKGGRRVKTEWWGSKTGKTVKLPYRTMTLDEMGSLDVPASENAHLYLWTTNKFLEAAYSIARKWGFEPSQVLTWCKPPMGIGFGGTYCGTTEFCLFCRRGTLRAQRRVDSTWWEWSRPYEAGHIAHSAKPEAFIDMVESVSPGPYLEMFARRNRLGWSTWGNECLNHIGAVAPAAQEYNMGK